MDIHSVITILFIGTSASIGALLGVLRSKIFASKYRTNLHYVFYIFSVLVFATSLVLLVCFWSDFVKPTVFAWIAFIAAITSSAVLFGITMKYLVVKDTFKTDELNPIINKFTSMADKSEIKLLGGDLSFFGDSSSAIDQNIQYTYLRSKEFNKILILCKAPQNAPTKIRYGKILRDMPTSELRFYRPSEADLKVRGRIIKVSGVEKLLMYTKGDSGYYEAIETDTSKYHGALYNSIWDLVWSLAHSPTKEQLSEYEGLFTQKH